MHEAFLKLPSGEKLIINYDLPARLYFDYEAAGASGMAKLAFLGKVCKIAGNPATPEELNKHGIGRKTLGRLAETLFQVDRDRFQICDGAIDVLESQHIKFDRKDIKFDDSDSDIYLSSDWEKDVNELGILQANIEDIKRYCTIDGRAIAEKDFDLIPSEGGIGWLLGAILLKIAIAQGKLDVILPEPCSSSPNGLDTTSSSKSPALVPKSE